MLIVSHEAAFGLEGVTVLMSIHGVLGKILVSAVSVAHPMCPRAQKSLC